MIAISNNIPLDMQKVINYQKMNSSVNLRFMLWTLKERFCVKNKKRRNTELSMLIVFWINFLQINSSLYNLIICYFWELFPIMREIPAFSNRFVTRKKYKSEIKSTYETSTLTQRDFLNKICNFCWKGHMTFALL
jgi:hypothetical protein